MRTRIAIAALAAACCLAAAGPASADSISYIKDGNIWLTTPDGSRQYQVTNGGGYSYASQADDGTIIGLFGRRLHRIARDGRILADFATPVSGDTGPNNSHFKGPFDPQISPDGTKVAYSYAWQYYYTDPGCTPPGCTYQRLEVGVGYSHADRLTPWDEPGLGRQSGWTHPSWINNQQTLLSERSVIFGNTDSIIDTVGNGNQTIDYWFNDDNAWYLQDGEISTAGGVAAFVGQEPSPDGMTADIIAIYRMNGAAPALPEQCYRYTEPNGSFDSPSFSPDGRGLAFGNEYGTAPGILVAQVPDQRGGCQLPSAGGQMIVPGGAEPDWGPAGVPTRGDQKGAGKKGGKTGVGGVACKSLKGKKLDKCQLKSALKKCGKAKSKRKRAKCVTSAKRKFAVAKCKRSKPKGRARARCVAKARKAHS